MRAWFALFALLFACAVPARAHLMPSGQGTLKVEGRVVSLVVALPVTALQGYDDDGDGRITADELDRHRSQITPQLATLIQLRAGGAPGQLLYEDLIIAPDDDGTAGTTHPVLMRRVQWPQDVQALEVEVQVFAAAQGDNRQLSLRAVHGSDTDLAVLSAQRPVHRFFKGPWATTASFVAVGAEHILLGWDHLLFLLTVLALGGGWRHGLIVISGFTVAHSITLVLAVTGLVPAPAMLVEPAIAASIVLLGLDNLRRRETARSSSLAWRGAVVFGCGLLHGLGFATALTQLQLVGAQRVWSLLGFNLGVELGQAMFVLGVLAAMHGLKQARPGWSVQRLYTALSATAALAGAALLVQRWPWC